MMAIVLSTADSFLNSAAVGIINDVYVPLKNDYIGERERLRIVRIANLMVGIMSILIALFIPDLLGILEFSYSFWAPIILPALIFTIFGVRLNKLALWMGIICGAAMTLFWEYSLDSPYAVNSIIVGFIANFIITWIINKSKSILYIEMKKR